MLVVAIAVVALVVLLSGALVQTSQATTRSSATELDVARCEFLVQAASSRSLREIHARVDLDGEGIGATGVAVPVQLFDSAGSVIGEYRSRVQASATGATISSLAAVPSFGAPSVLRAYHSELTTRARFLLAPEAAALSILGDPATPVVSGGSETIIEGHDAPAISVSSVTQQTSLSDALSTLVSSGDLDPTDIRGTGPSATYGVEVDVQEFVTSSEYEAMRTAMRQRAAALVASADRTVTTTIVGDATWGSASSPQTTVLDASAFMGPVFGTDGQTITGAGTLIIEHDLIVGGMGISANIVWTGDVIVVGHSGDTAAGESLLDLYGSSLTVDGNLIILAHDSEPAKLAVRDRWTTPSQLTVTGSTLILADSTNGAARIDVRDTSSVIVNGTLEAVGRDIGFGSHDAAHLTVNGGLAGAFPTGGTSNRTLDLTLQGVFDVEYDAALVKSATQSLADLQTSWSLVAPDASGALEYRLTGGAAGDAIAELEALEADIATNGAGYDYGISP